MLLQDLCEVRRLPYMMIIHGRKIEQMMFIIKGFLPAALLYIPVTAFFFPDKISENGFQEF